MGGVKSDDVVAQQEDGAFGELVQPPERLREITTVMRDYLAGIATHRRKSMNATAVDADLEVDRQATRRKRLLLRFGRRLLWSAFYLLTPNPHITPEVNRR